MDRRVVVKRSAPSKKCLLDAVCCVLCVLSSFPNALQTLPYYHSAMCPSVFRHIPEMLYHSVWWQGEKSKTGDLACIEKGYIGSSSPEASKKKFLQLIRSASRLSVLEAEQCFRLAFPWTWFVFAVQPR
jgi:hypothetical protein